MESISQIQSLFLQWHKHKGICSIEQIRTACSNIMKSFNLNTKHSLFKVFFPLVRKGFIEFYGDGKYQVSQPTILYYPKEQIAVGVNLWTEQKEMLVDTNKIREDEFGVVRFNIANKQIQDLCFKFSIDYSVPNVSEILSNFPKIFDIVEKFERAYISSNGEYYDVVNKRWSINNNQNLGVFRLSDDSSKFYLRADKRDFQIPDSKINPEGRPLAESFQAVVEKIQFLSYQKSTKALTIKDINIPIIIERVLRLASLTLEDGVKEEYDKSIYHNITLSTVRQLDRIFGIKTIIKE